MGIIVDLFAGGGGASQGIFEALGRHPDAAVNHDPQAIAIHKANHAETEHWCNDVWAVDPSWVGRGRPVDLLWASPDCTHHSKAKGGAPKRDVRRRDLALVLTTKWIPALKPLVVVLENVEEFRDWGPLDSRGVPIECARGETFRAFVNALRRYGYAVQWRELVAADYGAPTSRKRLFLIARRDKRPIVWPKPTHGAPDSPEVLAGTLRPWRTAAEIIDWGLPCPSIFASAAEIWNQYGLRSQRPLKENTLRRIFKGVQRYVLENPAPFIVNLAHTRADGSYDCFRGGSLGEPLPTVTQKHGFAMVAPYLAREFGCSTGAPVTAPAPTVMATGAGKTALVAPVLASYYGPKNGSECRAKPLNSPLLTQTTENRFALVAAFLDKYNGKTASGYGLDEPIDTLSQVERFSLVSAFLVGFYNTDQDMRPAKPLPTVMTRDHFGLVTVQIHGEPYIIADIGMRMLAPAELLLAQGFPASYTLAEVDGKQVPKSAQVAMIGNSVCPPLARAIVRDNYAESPQRDRPSASPPLFRMFERPRTVAMQGII